jgi:hypothetical protein
MSVYLPHCVLNPRSSDSATADATEPSPAQQMVPGKPPTPQKIWTSTENRMTRFKIETSIDFISK